MLSFLLALLKGIKNNINLSFYVLLKSELTI